MKRTEPLFMPDTGRESRVLCAVSGGADSIALLHLCHVFWAQGRFAWLGAAHFHHGLRAGADEDERFVRAFCAKRSIDCFVGRGDTGTEARRRKLGVEETARLLRYNFLEQCARDTCSDVVLTAHTADDNLETILMNLTRGAGLDGLCGIPPERGIIARPLLEWTREDILAYLERHNLAFREDESNADTRFRRNRLRREVVPVLRGLNPAVSRIAGQTAHMLRADAEYLQSLADAELIAHSSRDGRFPAARLLELPQPVALRVLRTLCVQAGLRDIGRTHVEAMLKLCASTSPHAETALPGGLKARRCYGELSVGPAAAPKRPLPLLQIQEIGLFEDKNIYKSFNSFFVADDTIKGEIRLRTRQSGDTIALPGGGGTKTLRKLMIDRKIPLAERDTIPVVADDAGVIAVAGLGVDRSRLPHPGAKVLELAIESRE